MKLLTGECDAEAFARSLNAPEEFEVVFERHFATIHRYLRRRVGTELAQELAAETFLQAFRGRKRFAGGEALPWLYGIAANLLRMHRRTEERRLRAYSRVAALEPDRTGTQAQDIEARIDSIEALPGGGRVPLDR